MRSAEVSMHGIPAGILEEMAAGNKYRFTYFESYNGPSIALTIIEVFKGLPLFC